MFDDDELLPVSKHVMNSPPRAPESHTSHNISIDSAENVAIGHGSVINNYYYCPVFKNSEGSQIKSNHELLNFEQRYRIANQGSPAVNPQTHCTPTKKSRVSNSERCRGLRRIPHACLLVVDPGWNYLMKRSKLDR
ncbi:hypothetical protein Btru_023844 [Bulinus truncatus]|nr:hypothetical protein Btru_023844 [Bulinus truncatus]